MSGLTSQIVSVRCTPRVKKVDDDLLEELLERLKQDGSVKDRQLKV